MKSLLSDFDIYLFKEGTHTRLYEKLGSHITKDGVYFALWAPNASYVSSVGDFNNYDPTKNPLSLRNDGSGIWEGIVKNAHKGQTYKYYIVSNLDKQARLKADPFAIYAETPPKSASIIWDTTYKWHDQEWMNNREKYQPIYNPISIYEVHLGSWRRRVEKNNSYLSYTEAAEKLAAYLKQMNFTHIELLPIMEHPFDGSWGYQVTGYYAPTSRFGRPEEFMTFVDIMHKFGIGVILDWVVSHFAVDGHGLLNFDGSCLYEHQDPRLGYHPQWKSAIFNYGRYEVKAFLISNAVYWFDKYHIDGLRVDGVSSMLYLDFGRENGSWIPNKYGGRENLEAIEFLQTLNKTVYSEFKGVMTIAEESSAYPKVSHPVHEGGLGFGFKWNMGWMHDTLSYFKYDPIFRAHHHNKLTFSIWYAFSENFVLPLSHDEVVHMKGSLINKMPGSYEEKFANLRALFAYMFAHPGKKLLFMGSEFAQFSEWDYAKSLDWHLLKYPKHKGIRKLLKTLNTLYKTLKPLHKWDTKPQGFRWIDVNNAPSNILSFLRIFEDEQILIICNFSGIEQNYRVGLSKNTDWIEILNSQSLQFGGWDKSKQRTLQAQPIPYHGFNYSAQLNLPPLSVLYFKPKS